MDPHDHSIPLDRRSVLWVWGLNNAGQLGDSTLSDKKSPVLIGNDNKWVSISAAVGHTLGLKSDGTLWVWGDNSSGQVGNGNTTNIISPVQIGTGTNWRSIAAGGKHSFGLKSDGTLWSWGTNIYGQLGDGTTNQKNTPQKIGTDNKWISISTGANHSLGIKSTGSLWTWGNNALGQLGTGTTNNRYTPVQLGTIDNWVQIESGDSHSIGLKSDRDLFCATGRNDSGQIGNGVAGINVLNFTCSGIECMQPSAPTAMDQNVCRGEEATITATGTGTIGWYSAPAGGLYLGGGLQYVSAKLTADTAFYVQDSTCSASATRTKVKVKLLPLPLITANANNKTVCEGTSVILTASGANAYQWSGAINNGVPFFPTITSTYIVTGTDSNGCSSSDSITISVLKLPVVLASASDTIVCAGDSVTLSGSGANYYIWTGGITNGVSFKPSGTFIYNVIGTDTNGCSKSASIKIIVNPSPIIKALATDSSICIGEQVTLTGSGADMYVWNSGVIDGLPFIPAATKTYSLTGTDSNNCTDSTNITINVNPHPVVLAHSSAGIVCEGTLVTLSGSGASTYSWTNGVNDGVPFAAQISQTFTVTGIDSNNCSDTATIDVTVKPMPVATTMISGTQIGSNQTGATYQWLDCNNSYFPIPNATGQFFTPLINGDYAVRVTANDCSDTSACVNISTVGIGKIINFQDQLIIYPNPGTGRITIISAIEGQYLLVNGLGQLIQHFKVYEKNHFSVTFEDLANGVYYIISDHNESFSPQKIIVIK